MIAAGVAAAALAPAPSAAQEPSAEEQLDDVRAQGAEVALEIDVLAAQDAEIQAALATLQTNVAAQQTTVATADQALATAEGDVATSAAAIATLEQRIIELDQAADQMVIDAFVDPPINHALDAFRARTLTEATVKQALVEIQAQADADTLEQLDQARAQLEVDQAAQEELVAVAADKKAEADEALAGLEAALAQQSEFAAAVEERLNAKLAEAESLKLYDAQLSNQIALEQAQLAASLQAAQAAAAAQPAVDPAPSTIAPAPGGLATVTCPSGGSITVAGSIAGNVQALLDAAAADGVALCGGGYRDPEAQIQLRIAHCGSSNYAIYEMPASQCDPPTARPGTSLHEQGLAIDFTCNGGGAIARGSSCWNWLSAHADEYGLYNLPTEAWHWSTTGA
jgi:LAS superfamily LD-carboxypeptidase LdcB